MIPQKGGGESWAPQDHSELCPCGSRGGHLFKQEAFLKRGATVLLICGGHRQFFMG